MEKKLNEVTKVTTMETGDYVVLNTAAGGTVQIKKVDLANALAEQIKQSVKILRVTTPIISDWAIFDPTTLGLEAGEICTVRSIGAINGPALSGNNKTAIIVRMSSSEHFYRYLVFPSTAKEAIAIGMFLPTVNTDGIANPNGGFQEWRYLITSITST